MAQPGNIVRLFAAKSVSEKLAKMGNSLSRVRRALFRSNGTSSRDMAEQRLQWASDQARGSLDLAKGGGVLKRPGKWSGQQLQIGKKTGPIPSKVNTYIKLAVSAGEVAETALVSEEAMPSGAVASGDGAGTDRAQQQ